MRGYFLILGFFRGVEQLLFVLVIIEILSWVFILIAPKNIVFFYLVLQSYFVIWGLFSLLISEPLLLMVAIFLKSGLPPMHSWILRLLILAEKFVFWFVSSIHKFFPIFVMVFLLRNIPGSITFLFVSMCLPMLLAAKRAYLVLVVGLSSIMHTGWVLLSCLRGTELVIKYLLFYYLALYLFVLLARRLFLMNLSFNQNSLLRYLWLIISGIPPFVIFWLKLGVVTRLIIVSIIFSFAIIFLMVFIILRYFRRFSLNLIEEQTYSMSAPFIVVVRLLILRY